jgi:hypothetical protein
LVAQLSTEEIDAGDDGWFADSDGDGCRPNAGIRFSAGAQPPTGTVVVVTCTRAQTVNAAGEIEDVPIEECEPTDSTKADDVGAACLPAAIPALGFDPRIASVEIRSDQCDSEVCLVLGLDGDPRPDCQASEAVQCPTQDVIEQSVYCSCRCDAPDGDPGPLCECAEGFACLETIADGLPGIRGSYCVRNE